MKTPYIFSTFAAILCTGCVPFPHTVVWLPAITGHVVKSGVPVAGAQLLAAQGPLNEPCSTTSQLAITDAYGAFKIEKDAHLKFLYAPLVAPISVASLSLCIGFGGTAVFADKVMWKPYDAEEIVLECDLASSRTVIDMNSRRRIVLCQAT